MTDYSMADKVNIGKCGMHLWARDTKKRDSVPFSRKMRQRKF